MCELTPDRAIYLEFLATYGCQLDLLQQKVVQRLVEDFQPDAVVRYDKYLTIDLSKMSMTTLKGIYQYICSSLKNCSGSMTTIWSNTAQHSKRILKKRKFILLFFFLFTFV